MQLQAAMRSLALALLGLAQVARAVAQHALDLAAMGDLGEQQARRIVAARRPPGACAAGGSVTTCVCRSQMSMRSVADGPVNEAGHRVRAQQLEGRLLARSVHISSSQSAAWWCPPRQSKSTISP